MVQIVAAKGERGILPEQLALKLLWSFRGLHWGRAVKKQSLTPYFAAFPNRPRFEYQKILMYTPCTELT